MPIYEYQCAACGHVFDALQKVSDAPLTDCPECGVSELRKLLSAPRFRLKGKGWYETDFKTGDKRNLHDGSKEKDKGAQAKGDTAKSDGTDKKAGAKDDKKSGKKSDKSSKSSGGNDAAQA